MHIRWHGEQLIAVSDIYQRPERALDLRLPSYGRFDEVENRCRLEINPEETGLTDAPTPHACHHPSLTSKAGWLPPLDDEATDSEIPLRTGCDAAALSILDQMAAGPGWIFASRIRSLNSVQNAASRVSEVNPTVKGGGNPYSG
jgi:hypothetical protein